MIETASGAASASAADWAFEELFRVILAREISPDARLTEAALSEQLGVSRTPLRDALQRLEMAGVVARRRNRSIKIVPLTLEEMQRLSMLREVLEGLLVRWVAIRHAQAEISLERLEQIVAEMKAIDGTKGIVLQLRLGREFHREIASLSGDPMSTRMLEQVMLSFERYRHLVENHETRAAEIAMEHGAVVDAIKNGEAELAEQLMRQHLANARAIYADCLVAGKHLT